MNTSERHPATLAALRPFVYDHLPPALQEISLLFASLALTLVDRLPDDPELTTALRQLRKAKDCAVFLASLQLEGKPTDEQLP